MLCLPAVMAGGGNGFQTEIILPSTFISSIRLIRVSEGSGKIHGSRDSFSAYVSPDKAAETRA
jgi:hypothetical protein